MRFWVKLGLLLAIACAVQVALPLIKHCAWEVHFAARCMVAGNTGDQTLHEQLVEEARMRMHASGVALVYWEDVSEGPWCGSGEADEPLDEEDQAW